LFSLAQNVLRVPYRQQHGAMMVQVEVNHVMMDFIIDTGATACQSCHSSDFQTA